MKFLTALTLVTLLAACGTRSSDEEQVRAVVEEMEKAAEARDTSDVLEHIAANYTDAQGFDRAQLQQFLRGYFLAHPKLELLVSIDSLEFPAEGLAQAEITVTSVALDADRARLKVEFRREGGDWQVSRADRLRQ